jgi:hypothetical protein
MMQYPFYIPPFKISLTAVTAEAAETFAASKESLHS